MRRDAIHVRAAIVAALLVALIAVSASAQYQTGNIYGKTVAKDGSLLPGVTVTLSGVGAPQTAVSDGSGDFRFVNLSPGTYTLRAELAGMGTAVRTGVGVRVGANADIELVLNPSVSEAITVSAEAPLLDVRKSGTGTTVDQAILDKVPTARDPWMILQSTPGVFVDRINVGGTQSGQQSIYISKGAPRQDGTWNVDGVNITDMGATGSSPTYYDFDTFEEFQITTGGSDPRIQTAGVQMNMVTKRGTNDYTGSGRYLYVPGSTSSEASVPSEATGYLVATNKVNYVRDYGGEVGGPILKDRLWIWLARGDQKISAWQSQGRTLSGPNAGQPAFIIPDDTILRNKNAKINGQIADSNSAVASYTFGDKYRNARDLSPFRPFETAYTQTGPTKVYKVEDTQLFGPNFYLTGMWSKVQGGFGLFANGGQGPDAPSLWFDPGNVAHDSFSTFQTVRPQKQLRVDGSWFAEVAGTNHEFKFGYGYRNTPVDSATTYPGAASGTWDWSLTSKTLCETNGLTWSETDLTKRCSVATLFRPPLFSYSGKYNELYVGDTMMFHNLTIQAGIRYDDQKSAVQPLDVQSNPILATPLTLPCITTLTCTGGSLTAQLPGVNYPGQDEELHWKGISPRLGLTYALGAEKKTLLRAAYNRYMSQLGSAVSSSSPVGNSQFTFLGHDSNGDHTIQRSELVRVRNFAGINPAAPSSIVSTRRVDYDMNPPHTDEFLVGAEHELWSDFAVGVTFTHRVNNDLPIVRYEKTQGAGDWYTAADYEPAFIAGGTYTGQFYTVTVPNVQVYQLKAGLANPNFSVITNRPNYKQTYNGFEVTATKRMSHQWMLRVNASYNDYKEDCGEGSFANPTPALPSTGLINGAAAQAGPANCLGGLIAPQSAGSGAFGNVFLNSKWNTNFSAVYVAPWDINIGANLLARQGYPNVYRVTSTPVAPRGGTPGIVFQDMGDSRFDNVYQLDLRVAKDFRLMSLATFTVSADIFNATNQRTILQRNGVLSTASTANTITEIQAPRVFRIGGKVTF
jgi:hypothetical protein